MNTKTILLFTAFTLMSWQEAFAGAPEFPEKPKVSTTAQPQGSLLGQMIPGTMRGILKNLSFKDGWMLLSTNQFHHEHTEVWTVFADVYGASVAKDVTTTREIRKKIIKQSKDALRAAIPSGGEASFVKDVMINLLHSAQEKPFLWSILTCTLLRKVYSNLSVDVGQGEMNNHAYYGNSIFKDVPETSRRAYLVAVSLLKDPDGTGAGEEDAQIRLNKAAYSGKLGFTQDRGTPTSGYDYLVTVAARMNPDRTPGLGAKHAQKQLKNVAQE